MLCVHVIVTIEIVILGISQASPFLNKLARPDLQDSEDKEIHKYDLELPPSTARTDRQKNLKIKIKY